MARQPQLSSLSLFNSPTVEQARRQRRENLFTQAVQAGQASPGARLGAGLAALGTRLFGGEGEQVQRAQRMKRARERISQEIGDPMALLRDDQAVSQASAILQEEGLQREAQTLPFQIAQFRGSMPEPQSRRITLEGGTPKAEAFAKRTGFTVPEGRTFSVEIAGDRVVGDKDITGEQQSERGQSVNVRLPNGNIVAAIENQRGNLINRQTGQPLPGDVQRVSLAVNAQSGEDLPKSSVEKLQTGEIAVRNYTNTAQDALNILEDTGSVNTLTARGVGFLQDLNTEVQSFANALNIDFDADALDHSTYNEKFRDLGIDNSRLRGLITSLAFQAAAASGQEGRAISNRDIERFVQEIGAKRSDPEAFAETLKDSVKRSQRRFKTAFKVRTGKDFEGSLPGLNVSGIEDTEQESGARDTGVTSGGVDYRYDPEQDRLVPVE